MCDFFLQEFKETLHFHFSFLLVRGVRVKKQFKKHYKYTFLYIIQLVYSKDIQNYQLFSEVIL